jgi:putative Mg2+ transporter-C (MgtC) family protein
VLFKLALAIFIGKLIGRERKRNYKPGGSRTFSIICLGATLIPILSLELEKFGYSFDFVRLFAYGLVSLGFATSGIVRTFNNKVEGLTTAGTIWVCAIIGFFIGMGLYPIAILSTLLMYAVLDSKYKKISRRKKNVKKKSKSRVSKSV